MDKHPFVSFPLPAISKTQRVMTACDAMSFSGVKIVNFFIAQGASEYKRKKQTIVWGVHRFLQASSQIMLNSSEGLKMYFCQSFKNDYVSSNKCLNISRISPVWAESDINSCFIWKMLQKDTIIFSKHTTTYADKWASLSRTRNSDRVKVIEIISS